MRLKKRLVPFLLMFFMFLVMFSVGGRRAEAAEPTDGTLTIKKIEGDTSVSSYEAYKIVSFNVRTIDGKKVFTDMNIENTDYRDAITTAFSTLKNKSDRDILTYFSGLEIEKDKERALLAIALKDVVTKVNANYTHIDSANGVFSNMSYGYYLVIETGKDANNGIVISKPILISVPKYDDGNTTVEVTAKTSQASIEKKIVEGDGNNITLLDSNTAAIDEEIKYQSISTIPSYNLNNPTYYITDTFSDGLSFVSDSLKVFIVKENGTQIELEKDRNIEGYTLQTKPIIDDSKATFRITLKPTEVKSWGNSGCKLLVTYRAKLNGSALCGNAGNPNAIKLTYSVDNGTGIYEKDDTVKTYTTEINIKKFEGIDESKLLNGAEFELTFLDNGLPKKFGPISTGDIAGKDGIATFSQLKPGSYTLKETKAPNGYDILQKDITFDILANKDNDGNYSFDYGNTVANIEKVNGCFTIKISNNKGFTLPGTGGIGTTIFTVCGIIIVLLGSCMGVLYIKKHKTVKQQ